MSEENFEFPSSEQGIELENGDYECNFVPHPVLARMLLEAPTDVELLHEWTDDHIPCIKANVVFPDQTYTIEWWWCGVEGPMKLCKTINNLARSVEFVMGFDVMKQ